MRRVLEPFAVLVLLCAYLPAAASLLVLLGARSVPIVVAPAVAYLIAVCLMRWRRPDLRLPGRSQVRHCTTRELCQAWRRSEEMLRAASGLGLRVRLVTLRQAYLDALERRDPVGFAVWVSLSRTGGGPPDAYIGWSGRFVREE